MIRRRQLDIYAAKPLNRTLSSVKGYEFVRLDAAHFEKADFCEPRLGLFRSRLADGFEAHGLITPDGELAYYMWLSFGRDQGRAPWAFTAEINLPASSGYIFDCKTAPEHRRKGLYTAALKYARALCHKAGCERVLIDVEPVNAPAVKAIASAGFTKKDSLAITKFGPVMRLESGGASQFGWKRFAYPA